MKRYTLPSVVFALALLSSVAVRAEAPTAPAAKPAKPALDYVEMVTGGASAEDALPLVIAIHGLGDSPEGFARVVRGYTGRARFIVPRAPDRWRSGWSWFPTHREGSKVELALAGIQRSATILAGFIADMQKRRPTVGRPIVTGFSQGGILSFQLAAAHPESVGLAIPLAGWLPPPLVPQRLDRSRGYPKVRALHGRDDDLLPLEPTRASVAALAGLGMDVTLEVFPGVGHRLPRQVRESLWKTLRAATATTR